MGTSTPFFLFFVADKEKPPKRKGQEYEEEKPPKRKGKECEEEKPPKPAQPESLASFMRSVLEDLKKNPERYNRRIQQPSLNDKAICEAALQKYNLDKGEEYEYWTVCSPYTSTVDGRYHFNFIGKHQTKSAEFFFADVGYVEPDNYDAVKCELVHENYYPGDEKVKWQFVIHPHAIPCNECNYE
ncbi:unnamed protein product [Amaranthus hypochondriacus]